MLQLYNLQLSLCLQATQKGKKITFWLGEQYSMYFGKG